MNQNNYTLVQLFCILFLFSSTIAVDCWDWTVTEKLSEWNKFLGYSMVTMNLKPKSMCTYMNTYKTKVDF